MIAEKVRAFVKEKGHRSREEESKIENKVYNWVMNEISQERDWDIEDLSQQEKSIKDFRTNKKKMKKKLKVMKKAS